MESQVSYDYIDSNNRISYEKIRRICHAMQNGMPTEVIQHLLQMEGDINYEIPKNCKLDLLSSKNYYANAAGFDLLLKSGADFTRKNDMGKTIIHEYINYDDKEKECLYGKNSYSWKFENEILSAHVKYNVTANPSDENGISHFHIACMTNQPDVVEFFLKNGVDVDQTIKENSHYSPMNTGLHLAAKCASTETVKVLLKYGANMLLKNAAGLTAIHLIIEFCSLRLKFTSKYDATLRVMLNFAMDSTNDIKTIDDFGFSNLHVACILDDELLVESILENFENVNQAVNSDSFICVGYTSLHFAASAKIEIFKLLLNKGADIKAKNRRGQTPIDLCLQNYTVNEIHSIISMRKDWKNIVMSDKETKLLDVITAFETTDEFIIFLNSNKSASKIFVPFDSPLWPGYTMLHLSVIFAKQQINQQSFWFSQYVQDTTKVAECIKREADMTIVDANGSTALHLAFYMQKHNVVKYLLDHHDKTVNPVDQDNLSHFHIACAANHQEAVELFLSSDVDVNSPVLKTFQWLTEAVSIGSLLHYVPEEDYEYETRRFFICPGSTALHMNIASGNSEITKILLKHGADIHIKDVNGLTPVHRLLSTANYSRGSIVLLLENENLENCVTDFGFSHFHVACHFGETETIDKLLKSGANISATVNYKGKLRKRYYIDRWDPYGDPDEPLNFLYDYSDYAPLHFAMLRSYDDDINLLLIENGADFLQKAANGNFFLKDSAVFRDYSNLVLRILKISKVLQKYFDEKFGWTRLHVACLAMDINLVKKAINSGVDVNAKIYSDYPMWKGFTALHVVAEMALGSRYVKKEVNAWKKIVQLLMKNGADLFAADDNQDTPIHLHFLEDTSFMRFLFKCIKNYDVNPKNMKGISIFHVACAMHNVKAVEKFLKHGVDVNQEVNYFSDICPSGTPLHFLFEYYEHNHTSNRFSFKIWDAIAEIVDKLLKKGANVNAADIHGETALFKAVRLEKLRQVMMKKLISNGADVDTTNVYGNTPFELLLKQEELSWEEIELFLKAGCRFNTFNPISQVGYLSELFYWRKNDKIRSKILDHPHMTDISEEGRTIVHNLVSKTSKSGISVAEIIERLTIRGCDIDHQDMEGKTALLFAIHAKNTTGILGLIKNGADVNVIDQSGKTFGAYIYELLEQRSDVRNDYRNIIEAFIKYIHKLEFCGLYVNRQNKKYMVEVLREYPIRNIELNSFDDEVEKTKNINIGDTSLSLYQFLIDRQMDVCYMNMSEDERRNVDQFFQNTKKYNFDEIDCLLKLKYREAIQRTKLIEPALESLNILTRYQLPDLCCRMILRFLFNEDLKNLIDSVNEIVFSS